MRRRDFQSMAHHQICNGSRAEKLIIRIPSPICLGDPTTRRGSRDAREVPNCWLAPRFRAQAGMDRNIS